MPSYFAESGDRPAIDGDVGRPKAPLESKLPSERFAAPEGLGAAPSPVPEVKEVPALSLASWPENGLDGWKAPGATGAAPAAAMGALGVGARPTPARLTGAAVCSS